MAGISILDPSPGQFSRPCTVVHARSLGARLQGAVYIFEYNEDTRTWRQLQKILSQFPGTSERFGTALAMDDFFLAVGVPDRAASFVLQSTVRCPRVHVFG
jgi:hypothetical protein